MTSLFTSYQNKTFPFPFPFPNHTHKKPRHVSLKSQPNGGDGIIGDGIPSDDVKLLAKFKSRHNFIRVLQVSRRADHPLAGTRLLLLDNPGNIHSISFLSGSSAAATLLTGTYFDVLATFPPTLPGGGGPIALLGLGGASAVRPILRLHPAAVLHAWELDPAVVSVAREFFDLSRLESAFPGRLHVHVGDGLRGVAASGVKGGFAGIAVDLFSRGSLLPELQRAETWAALARCLRKGGRVMANVGGSCVEAEDGERDGRDVMARTLAAMAEVFGEDKVSVLSLGNDDSSLALTGDLPDRRMWKEKLPRGFRGYVDMWTPYHP